MSGENTDFLDWTGQKNTTIIAFLPRIYVLLLLGNFKSLRGLMINLVMFYSIRGYSDPNIFLSMYAGYLFKAENKCNI